MPALDLKNIFEADPRDARAGWAPGGYACKCGHCGCTFQGAKRSYQCADCAYGPRQDFATLLGARIHARRVEVGMTLQDLAKEAGITKSYAWQLDAGKAKSPGADVCTRVAEAMGVTLRYLLGAGTLSEAEDEAFRRRYLRMTEPMKAQVRAIAAVLGKA